MNREFELKIYTEDQDQSQLDSACGHDWTIFHQGKPVYFEGDDMTFTLGEARQLVTLLNRVGVCDESFMA